MGREPIRMNSEKEKKSKENETLTHPIGQTKKSNQDLNSIGEQGTKKTVKPHPQTLTLIPKSDEIRAQEPKKPKGEEGKGVAYLAVVHTGARGKERAGRGHCSPGSGHRGAAARPLDGGALTRWGTRTPARGPATAPGLAAPLIRLARSRSVSSLRLREERKAAKRERRERKAGGEWR